MRRTRLRTTVLTLASLIALSLLTAMPAAAQEIGLSISVKDAIRNLAHTWSVSKTGSTVSGLAGQTLPGASWTVNVSEVGEGASFVSGTILVKNLTLVGYPLAASAVMDDGSGLVIECPPNLGAGRETPCIVKGNVGPNGTILTINITLGPYSLTQSVVVNFTGSNTGGSATLTDTVLGVVKLNQTLIAGQGPWSFTVTDQPFVCQTQERGPYVNGVQVAHIDNTAFLEIAGGEKAGANAPVTYLCKAGFADVVKTTNGAVDTSREWLFPLFMGPDGFTSNWSNIVSGVSSNVDPDNDGVLPYSEALSPNNTYTICESELPAGWSGIWQVNGQPVVPYDPDQNEVPAEDLGNRCVDFGANTPYPIVEGQTVTFTIDNRDSTNPGGQPRTPGYWKNWNRCSGGNQALNADRRAIAAGYAAGEGWRAGIWLLEDILNPAIGGGITWDDILADGLLVPIDSCEEGVEILDSRVVSVNGNVGDGKKLSSDSARVLARSLLAAQANFAAGACTTPAVLTAAASAEALLDSINFDGTSTAIYLKSGAVAQQALALHGILDGYNNGNYCGAP